MFMKISNLTFIFFLTTSTILISSSSNWLLSWICLEINLMSLIPLLMYKIKFTNSSSSIKYFIVQAMASILLFISIIICFINFGMNFYINEMNLITIALAMKLGMPPFQFWVPQVIENINMIKILLVLVWQKIAPMILISYCLSNLLMIMMTISALTGALGALNQNNFKKIFFYSSLVHLSWMLISLMISEKTWLIYLISYSSILIPLAMWCYMNKLVKMNKINLTLLNITQKMFLIMSILSLAGLPPFLGFIIKIMVIKILMSNELVLFLSMFLAISSLLAVFYYFKLTWMTMMSTYSKNKLILNYSTKKKIMFMLILMTNLGCPLMVFLA